jgi:hypothetical protein
MTRKGREFELLIERLEKIALPEGAKISSPGFINDRITGEQREVDILIEHKIGSFEIKIVIECRNRTSVQDTTWIEQIYTKLHDINIHKAIAVSTSSFTQPAIEKAKFYNIETRTFKEINSKLIESWWAIENIKVYSRQFNIISAIVASENQILCEEIIKNKTVTTKFIYTADKQIISLNDIFYSLIDKIDDFDNLIPNGTSIKKSIVANYINPDDRFTLKENSTEIGITQITFEVELRLILQNAPISKVSKYGNEGEDISHIIEFNNLPIDFIDSFEFVKNPNGSLNLFIKNKINK